MPLSDPVQAVCLTINLLDGTVLTFLRVLASKEGENIPGKAQKTRILVPVLPFNSHVVWD